MGILVETGQELFTEYSNHNFLPESEEDCDFNGQKLK